MTCVMYRETYLYSHCCLLSILRDGDAECSATYERDKPSSFADTDTRPVLQWSTSVSPIRNFIAFNSNRGGEDDLFVISANGKDQRQLTHTPEDEGNLAWTKNGKEILFSVFKDGTSSLLAIDPREKNQRELARAPGRAHLVT